jgi:hypothetical protein
VRNEGHTPGSGIRAARVSQESLQQRHVSPMLPIPNTCHRRVDQLAQGDGRDKGAEGQGDRFHGPLRGRLVRPHASMRIVLGRPHRQLVLYDGVLRANWVDIEEKMRKKFAHQVGSRVTHSIEMSGEQCVRLATEHNGTCVESELRKAVAYNHRRIREATGLGLGRSGGALISVALAFCDAVDVYGGGVYASGPGSDAIYHHWYDRHFPKDCQLDCLLSNVTINGRITKKERMYQACCWLRAWKG